MESGLSWSSNPLARTPEVDSQQQAAYAELAPITLGEPVAAAHARALAVAFAGLALDAAGFVEGAADQPPSVATALTWMFGPGVGAAFVLTACVLGRYRFDERKQAQARAILARRAAGRRAVTPASAR
jgi:hypothetical protein